MKENTEKALKTSEDRTKNILASLASTYEGQVKKEITRDVFVVLNIKKTKEKGKEERPLTIYEAFSYVVSCRTMGLNPLLKHLQVLEGENYITLDGHLFNAQNDGSLISNKTELIEKDIAKKYFRYKCTIVRLIGGREVIFEREASADPSSIARKFVSTLFVEQMAEGRATRRCLKVAFPVGCSHAEDREIMNITAEESMAGSIEVQQEITVEDILTKINEANDFDELDKIKRTLPPIFSKFSDEDKKRISEHLKVKLDAINNKNIKYLEKKEPEIICDDIKKANQTETVKVEFSAVNKKTFSEAIKEIPDKELLANAIKNFEKSKKWNEEDRKEIDKAFEDQFKILEQEEIEETIKNNPSLKNV